MDEIIYRLLILVAFLGYMAVIYLALHIVVAHLTQATDSRLLWFFSVVTQPLTWPVRAVLPPGTPEAWVRYLTLGVYLIIWLGARLLLAEMDAMGR
jgi:hypothetical protein